MEKDNKKIQIIDNEGIKRAYTILFSFDSDNTKKHYIVYTDYSKNKEGKVIIHSACYNTDSSERKLETIDTEYELSVINGFLTKIEETLNKK